MGAEDRRSTDDALLGRTIAGKFTIESRIGGGGMGAVYRARQAGLDKIVAVKVLHRELMAEPTFASRFKREATSTSRIDHPSSLRVLDFGEEPDGLLFIAMEYLEGRTLFKVLREEAPLSPKRIVALSRQILAALAAAHELGIVHRDLKPENVIILPAKDDDGGASEHVKVCDFGIAKLQAKGETDEKLTVEGSIVGTPEYLSPEQARGGQLDARSDLYSMGVILFEMLTGEPPFRGDTPLAIVLKHIDAPPPRPSTLTPTVDLKLEEVCLKALSKAPGDRYASAREMRAALSIDSARETAPPAPTRTQSLLVMAQTPPPPSARTPVPLTSRRPTAHGSGARPRLSELSEAPPSGSGRTLAAVIAVALLGGGGGAYWFQRHAPPQPSHAAAAAHEAPTVAPSSTTAPSPTTPDEPTTAAPTASAMGSSAGAFPPSELPSAAPSAHHHHHHVPGASGGAAGGGAAEPPEPNIDGVLPANAQDLGATPPPPAANPVKVSLSNVQATNIAAGSVTAALPIGQFARCYHGAPGTHASVTVHLELSRVQTVARAAIADTALAALGACLTEAAKQAVVRGIPEGGATADVDIELTAP